MCVCGTRLKDEHVVHVVCMYCSRYHGGWNRLQPHSRSQRGHKIGVSDYFASCIWEKLQINNYTLSSRGVHVHVPSTISTCTQHVSGDRFLHACNNETHGTQTYCSTLHVYMSICMQADVCTTCSV